MPKKTEASSVVSGWMFQPAPIGREDGPWAVVAIADTWDGYPRFACREASKEDAYATAEACRKAEEDGGWKPSVCWASGAWVLEA